jgi:hypothetical protein
VEGYGYVIVYSRGGTVVGLTRNDITGIHGILVFDEPEAIHELDLGDLSGAMSVEMGLDISFGSYRAVSQADHATNDAQSRARYAQDYTYHCEGDYPSTTA